MGYKLTDKQERFCQEYCVDLNATQAAKRAGYSEDTAQQISSENLSKPVIQQRISELKQSTFHRLGITHERILTEYSRLAFSDLRKFYHETGRLKLPHEMDDDTAAALAGLESDEIYGFSMGGEKERIGETKKIKVYDKTKALEALGKHIGLFEKDNNQRRPELTIDSIEVVYTDKKDLNETASNAGIPQS